MMSKLPSEHQAATELHRAAAAVLEAGIPGAHLSVAIRGGPRFDACVGWAQVFSDRSAELPELTLEHAHDLGSVTKVAGTTAILAALASSRSVSLTAEVGRYLPNLPDSIASATLVDLLQHRAGLWEWWPTYLWRDDPFSTITALPLRYAPQAGRHYSDLGFMLLGRVVETIAAQSLPEAHRELVAQVAGTGELTYAAPPAGAPCAASSCGDCIERRMVATGKPYPVSGSDSRFTGWRTRVLVGEVNDGNAFHSLNGAAGHAGMFGTALGLHSLGRIMLASLIDGEPWTALSEFIRRGPDTGQLKGFRSWTTDIGGCRATVIGHPGFPGIGFGLVPRHDATVVLATNRLHVRGDPVRFGPLWEQALDAAHHTLHASGSAPNRPDL